MKITVESILSDGAAVDVTDQLDLADPVRAFADVLGWVRMGQRIRIDLDPTAESTCAASSGGETCALPPLHEGWHASNPSYDAQRREVRSGATWNPAWVTS
jgi:hypothetical protein